MSWIKNTLTLFVSCLVTLLLVELGLKMFPVLEVSRVKPLESSSNALEVSTIDNGELVNSYGWDFKNAVTRKTNNYGFFSDYNYEPDYSGVFVIGDSFVEARQVEFEQTFHQIVAQKLDEPVYNIAISGSPLSQYDAYAKETCEHFKPQRFIIPIIANDFDESLFEKKARAGFFHYHPDGTLKPTAYEVTWIRKLANRSSLVRYLYFNLSVGALVGQGEKAETGVSREEELMGQTYSDITDRFLANMAGYCVPVSAITYVLDAHRYEVPRVPAGQTIYGDSPATLNRFDYFKTAATNAGFNVVDLQEVMLPEYRSTKSKFEYPFDYHWNAEAHALVAKTLLERTFQ